MLRSRSRVLFLTLPLVLAGLVPAATASAAVLPGATGTTAGGLTGTAVTLTQPVAFGDDAIVVFVASSVANRAASPAASVQLAGRTFTRVADRGSSGSTSGTDREVEAHVLLAPAPGTAAITVTVPTPGGTAPTTFAAASQAVRGDAGVRLGLPDGAATVTARPSGTLGVAAAVPAGGLALAAASLRTAAGPAGHAPATNLTERRQGTNLRLVTASAPAGAPGVTVTYPADHGALVIVPFLPAASTDAIDALGATLTGDRTLPSEVLPSLAERPYDWAQRPRAGTSPLPYSQYVPWGLLDDAQGGNPQPAAKVEIGALDTWFFSLARKRWERVSSYGGLRTGAYYSDDFSRNSNDPSSQQVTAAGTMTIGDIPPLFNFHFYGPRGPMAPADIGGVVVAFRARLAPAFFWPWSRPSYVMAASLDWYLPSGAHADGGVGRFKAVDERWRLYTMSSLGSTTTLPPLDAGPGELR